MAYLRRVAMSAGLSFALAWLWVAAVPMAYMEQEYASWRAKQIMLDRCDLGDAIILGDSRAAAGILPARLPLVATNLAIGGGEPIEALSLLKRALACPRPPRLVILSFDPGHFTHPDLFWDRSVRFGLLSAADIAMLRELSDAAGDRLVYDARNTGGTPSWLDDRLRLSGFPTYSAGSLMHGGVFLRWPRNQRALAGTLIARGQYYFGRQAGSGVVAYDAHMGEFRPRAVLALYFDQILRLLEAHATDAVFVGMPVNEATWSEVDPANRDRFAAFLSGYERRYPRFRVWRELMPRWPNRLFGDQFCHLNPEGAERYSAELAQRLQDAPPSTQNDAQNGWLSGTARDASVNVAPISKRGS